MYGTNNYIITVRLMDNYFLLNEQKNRIYKVYIIISILSNLNVSWLFIYLYWQFCLKLLNAHIFLFYIYLFYICLFHLFYNININIISINHSF